MLSHRITLKGTNMLKSRKFYATGAILGMQVAANFHVEAESHDEAVAKLKAKLKADGWSRVTVRLVEHV
jgi:hypothetical protein